MISSSASIFTRVGKVVVCPYDTNLSIAKIICVQPNGKFTNSQTSYVPYLDSKRNVAFGSLSYMEATYFRFCK